MSENPPIYVVVCRKDRIFPDVPGSYVRAARRTASGMTAVPPRATYDAFAGSHALPAGTVEVRWVSRSEVTTARATARLLGVPNRLMWAGWYWTRKGQLYGPYASSRAAYTDAIGRPEGRPKRKARK